MREIIEVLIGDTIQITWVNSGVTPSPITATIFTGSETSIDSGTMTASGNGHFWRNFTMPDTPGFYVAETLATISAFPYKRRVKIHAVRGEVD